MKSKNRDRPVLGPVIVLLLQIASRLPLSTGRLLGRLVGRLGIWTNSRSWYTTRKNLELCYPAMDAVSRKKLARESMEATGQLLFETASVWLRDYRWVEQRIVAIKGLEKLQRVMASDKGVIVLAPHIGNWEVLGLYLSQQVSITNLYQPPQISALDNLIRTARSKSGATLVPTDRRGVSLLMKTLRSGGMTGILPDQQPEPGPGAEFAPFFGIPALTMTLVANLGRKNNCQYLGALAKRVEDGFEIHFIDVEPGIDSEDTLQALSALNRTVERCIEICPAQYQWEYKRFRKQPNGHQNPYRLPLNKGIW